MLDAITQNYLERHRADCAYFPISWWQKGRYLFYLGCILVGFFYHWHYTLIIVNTIIVSCYFGAILFRCLASFLSLSGRGEYQISDEEAIRIPEDALPIYTILVPLYKEETITHKIIRALNNLNYPPSKLDIKLLLEEDDELTRKSIENLSLPPHYEVIIVPHGQPKTKPKACNYGLQKARGELCVIYDAEDRPDPLQLRKVALAFQQAPTNLACIQAKLNYYNPQQNWLTRCFTIEYSTTFDLFLPGLKVMGGPIPLGGTSNHFRTSVLKELGGWDPFNVTEDCDLGVKIYKAGYITRMINSTTYEEANSVLSNWLRQRSRWTKGFFQTHLVHTRNPLQTIRQLGLWGFLSFLFTVGLSSLMMLFNIIYWIILLFYLGLLSYGIYHGDQAWDLIAQHPYRSTNFHPLVTIHGYPIHAWPLIYYGPNESPFWSTLSILFFAVSCFLLLANLLFVAMHLIACIKRNQYSLCPFALTMPFYWILISLGAWKGFIQLLTNPFYWEKTVHGLDNEG